MNGDLNRSFVKETSTCFILYLIPNKNSRGIRYYILEESTHYDYLGNLCDIIKGQQVNLDNLLKHGKYYVMNGGTQPSGYYNSYNTDAGTISISEGGNSCGYVQYNKENFWSGGHCYTLQNIENELTEKYLYHYLKSNEKKIMALRVGSGLPNIQKKDLMSLRIPIPAKENQKKISCLLDSIEDKISIETNMLKHDIRQVAATIEHDRGDASVLSLLGDQFADLLGGFGLGALETSEIAGQRPRTHSPRPW